MMTRRTALRIGILAGVVCLALGLAGAVFAQGSQELPQMLNPGTGFITTVATAFSSKISKTGEHVTVVVNSPVHTPDGALLPSGTKLNGRIEKIFYDKKRYPYEIRLRFYEAVKLNGDSLPVDAVVATADGNLTKNDAETLHYCQNPSYATLKYKIRKSLSSDQAVWNQQLGINQSALVDFETDDFMIQYNTHAVLVGVGDHLRLRFEP